MPTISLTDSFLIVYYHFRVENNRGLRGLTEPASVRRRAPPLRVPRCRKRGHWDAQISGDQRLGVGRRQVLLGEACQHWLPRLKMAISTILFAEDEYNFES